MSRQKLRRKKKKLFVKENRNQSHHFFCQKIYSSYKQMHGICWCQRWFAWLFALFLTYKEIDLISLLSSLRTKGSSARHTRAVDDRQSPQWAWVKIFREKKGLPRSNSRNSETKRDIAIKYWSFWPIYCHGRTKYNVKDAYVVF